MHKQSFLLTVFSILLSVLLTACGGGNDAGQGDPSSISTIDTANGVIPIDPGVFDVVDTNPSANIFEASFSADEQDVVIDGTTVHSLIYKDDNNAALYSGTPDGIPIPQIVVNVGDELVITLNNNLEPACAAGACNTSIHWHGIELDNDSDGTGVTQNRVEPGQSYTYRFKVPRAGVYWFHPHMKPGAQVFAGMYGVLIVKNPEETALQGDGTLPAEMNTFTVVLSDIEYGQGGDVGFLHDASAIGDSDNSTPGYSTPGTDIVSWHDLIVACKSGSTENSCPRFTDAATVLVNGQKPTASTPIIKAKSGAGVRLRLLNLATSRYFHLAVSNNGSDNRLYRVGGEGGLLESARLEGGVHGSWDTGYATGEIVLSASGRSDVVIVPTGNDGDIITITDLPYARSSVSQGPNTQGLGAGDLFYIQIDNSLDDTAYSIAENDPILGGDAIEDLKPLAVTDFYIAPVTTGNPGDGAGTTDPVIRLNNGGGQGKTAIDGVIGEFEDSGPDYTQVPYQDASRYAKTGDLLEFTITNFTGQHHPFHHHGFSFQPVRVIDNGDDKADTSDDTVLYEFDYDEFVDVIDVFDNQSMVVRMRLEDRPRITDTRQEAGAPAPDQFFASGGAAGRWVMHCHIFNHASLGMITELVVVDTDRDGDGFDTSLDCNDFDVGVNPDVGEICADGIDNNCDGQVDEAGCNNPPVADAGDDQVLECASHAGAVAMLDGTGSYDPDMDAITYLWSAPGVTFDDATSATPSATFPVGSTEVSLTVSDGQLEDSDDVNISVQDTTPPDINVSVTPDTLWAPNHKLVDIKATVTVTDACDPSPTVVLSAISSNEAVNGKGDGNTAPDISGADVGTLDTDFQLRAERSGKGNGRVYSIDYTAIDSSGNSASDTSEVTVPHSQ